MSRYETIVLRLEVSVDRDSDERTPLQVADEVLAYLSDQEIPVFSVDGVDPT